MNETSPVMSIGANNDELKIVQVNYWKEMRRELQDTMEKLHGLVLLTHNSVEFSDIVDFLNMIKKDKQQTIMYISLINSYRNIKNVLKSHPLVSKKLFVIDCVSGFLIELQDEVDCYYRRPPGNLEEMQNMIIKHNDIINPNLIVVDSLSQFINFTVPQDVELHRLYEFLRSIKQTALGITQDAIIMLYDDKTGSMTKLPTMFTEMIFKLEVIREKPEWKD